MTPLYKLLNQKPIIVPTRQIVPRTPSCTVRSALKKRSGIHVHKQWILHNLEPVAAEMPEAEEGSLHYWEIPHAFMPIMRAVETLTYRSVPLKSKDKKINRNNRLGEVRKIISRTKDVSLLSKEQRDQGIYMTPDQIIFSLQDSFNRESCLTKEAENYFFTGLILWESFFLFRAIWSAQNEWDLQLLRFNNITALNSLSCLPGDRFIFRQRNGKV